MRIAMLTNNYKPFIGGVPISIERLANGLRNLGHEVYVFAPSYEEIEDEEDDKYIIRYRCRKKKLHDKFVVPDIFDPIIKKVFSTLSFNIIHVHHPMLMGYTALLLGKKYNIPVVYTFHTRYEQYLHYIKPFEILSNHFNKDKTTRILSLEKKILFSGSEMIVALHNKVFMNRCNLVFAPTPSIKQYLQEHGTITKIEIMPTGLTNEDFLYEPDKVQQIRNTYLNGKTYLFCTVSRIEKEKNIDFLLEGLKLFKDKKGDCFRLLIIGDGTKRSEMENKVVELGLKDNIIFCGCISHEEIRNYYHACDLFLFTSRSETQGIVLLEAMATGLPVIALSASGVSDVVKDGINGYTTEMNTQIWESRIEEVLDNDIIKNCMQVEAIEEAKRYMSANVARTAARYYQKVLNYYGLECLYENRII